MAEILVIGGGLAGLTAALALLESGHRVTLLERRGGLGGRAYSILDETTGDTVDNGQHLFIAGFTETRRLLDRIGSSSAVTFEPRFRLSFASRDRGSAAFEAPDLPSPWHLAVGLLGFRQIPLADRMRAVWGARSLIGISAGRPPAGALQVEEWLAELGQPESVRAALWRPIAIAAMNREPEMIAATAFETVLRKSVLSSAEAGRLGIATAGLSDLFAGPARSAIESRGGRIVTGQEVEQLETRGNRIVGARIRGGDRLEADAYLAAVPPRNLARILPADVLENPWWEPLSAYESSPIVSVNLWLDRPVTDEAFVGLVGTQMHWLFNKSKLFAQARADRFYVSLVISSADYWIDRPQAELVKTAMDEISALFPSARGAKVLHARLFKEPDATWHLPRWSRLNPIENETPISNLVLAGDWTDSELPATVEAAIRSGIRAAKTIAANT